MRWEINHECLTLQDKVAEGKFAAIFLANWNRSNGQTESVALKMLKGKYILFSCVLRYRKYLSGLVMVLQYSSVYRRNLRILIQNSEKCNCVY